MKRKVILMEKPGKKRVVVPMRREGKEVEVLGLVLGEQEGRYELELVVDHQAARTRGNVEIRGVSRGGADVLVTGMIKIAKNAQNVEDFLAMRLLLLDKKSKALVEPKLEIEANDVVASHAASVGTLDPEHLHYLMSRGLEHERAEEILIDGFLDVVRSRIPRDAL